MLLPTALVFLLLFNNIISIICLFLFLIYSAAFQPTTCVRVSWCAPFPFSSVVFLFWVSRPLTTQEGEGTPQPQLFNSRERWSQASLKRYSTQPPLINCHSLEARQL